MVIVGVEARTIAGPCLHRRPGPGDRTDPGDRTVPGCCGELRPVRVPGQAARCRPLAQLRHLPARIQIKDGDRAISPAHRHLAAVGAELPVTAPLAWGDVDHGLGTSQMPDEEAGRLWPVFGIVFDGEVSAVGAEPEVPGRSPGPGGDRLRAGRPRGRAVVPRSSAVPPRAFQGGVEGGRPRTRPGPLPSWEDTRSVRAMPVMASSPGPAPGGSCSPGDGSSPANRAPAAAPAQGLGLEM